MVTLTEDKVLGWLSLLSVIAEPSEEVSVVICVCLDVRFPCKVRTKVKSWSDVLWKVRNRNLHRMWNLDR